MLPMVLHANTMVLDWRDWLKQADKKLSGGAMLSAEEVAKLRTDIEAMRKSGELTRVS